jgi:hypothetical protein
MSVAGRVPEDERKGAARPRHTVGRLPSRVISWERFDTSRCQRVRIGETSCCGAYKWVCQGGEFLVLRPAEHGYEETGRGRYSQARLVWIALVDEHEQQEHGYRQARLSPRRAWRRQLTSPGAGR